MDCLKQRNESFHDQIQFGINGYCVLASNMIGSLSVTGLNNILNECWRIWKIQMRSKVNDWWIWCTQTCKRTFDTESGPRLLRDFKLDEAEINEAMADSGRPLNSKEAASRNQVESLEKCLSGRTVPEVQIYATWMHLDLITPVACLFWRFKSCYLPWLRTSEMWNLKLNILHHFWAPPYWNRSP